MKLAKNTNTNSKTTVTKAGDNLIKITHSQSVLQSIGYQTGNIAYGVELFVADNPKAVEQGILRGEKIVEDALGSKLPEMQDLLSKLADANASK